MASRGSADIAERKRAALLRAAVVLGVFLLYPLLATFTPVLDGTIGRLSVAYLVGFLELMFALIVALTTRGARS